jgi:excisionase family DNA binding protein
MSADHRPPNCDDEFLTVAEVATTLRLSQQTVRNWIDQGSLPAVRIGRRVRITRRDLQRVLDAGSTAAAVAAADDPPYTTQQFWDGEPHQAAARGGPVEASRDTSRAAADHPEHEPAD